MIVSESRWWTREHRRWERSQDDEREQAERNHPPMDGWARTKASGSKKKGEHARRER